MKPLLIACDFDGTITQRDTLHVIVETFGEHGLWETLEPRLRSGEITVEQAMTIEFAAVRATAQQVADAVKRAAPLREGFVEWVDWVERQGHRLVVLSNGFRSVIAPVLTAAGLGHLDLVSHDARFRTDGCELIWSARGERCGLCDRPCKRQPLAERWNGEQLVYIGDGISDRCVSLQADVVFARDGLADHLAGQGVAYRAFDDFHQIRAELESLVGAAS